MGYEDGPKQSSLRGDPLHGGALSLRLGVRDRVVEVPHDDECSVAMVEGSRGDGLEGSTAVAMVEGSRGDGLEKSSGLSGLTPSLSSLMTITSSSVEPVSSSFLVGLKKSVTVS